MVQRLGSSLVKHKDGTLSSILDDTYDTSIAMRYDPSPRENMNAISRRTPTTIRVATWNLQGWNVAWTLYGKDLASKEMIKDRQAHILNAMVDYCGIQECLYSYDHPVSTMSIAPLNHSYFGAADWGGHVALTGYKYGNSLICRGSATSTHKVYDDQTTPSNDAEKRSYTKTVMNLQGVEVVIYNTHLSLDLGRRTNMLAELLRAASSETRPTIVLGDMNADMASGEFAGFIAAGFLAANNNDVNTSPTGTWYIDNILYRGFKRIVAKGTIPMKAGLSDHMLFYAELEV